MEKIYIPAPCPMTLQSLKKHNSEPYCSSCTKHIIDCRGLNAIEILEKLQPGDCGIFDSTMVQKDKKSLWYQFRYFGLVFLSSVGFSVQPIQAQSVDTTKQVVLTIPKKEKVKSVKEEKQPKTRYKKRKRLFTRKKNRFRYRTMGCPDF